MIYEILMWPETNVFLHDFVKKSRNNVLTKYIIPEGGDLILLGYIYLSGINYSETKKDKLHSASFFLSLYKTFWYFNIVWKMNHSIFVVTVAQYFCHQHVAFVLTVGSSNLKARFKNFKTLPMNFIVVHLNNWLIKPLN